MIVNATREGLAGLAVSDFYTEVIAKSRAFTAIQCIRDPDLLEPVTRAAAESIVADAASLGIKLIVTETYRSRERQAMLYAQKLTQLPTVGVHAYGLAFDVCKIVNGSASWAGDWAFLRDLCAKHGMISGLDWGLPRARHGFVDPDHVQRCRVSEQRDLFAGLYYPPESAVT